MTTLKDLQSALIEIYNFKCRPDLVDFPIYPENHIFNEKQSKEWNHKQYEKYQQAYEQECGKLILQLRSKETKATELAVDIIKQKLDVQEDKALLIWHHVYNLEHKHPLNTIDHLEQELEFLKKLYN